VPEFLQVTTTVAAAEEAASLAEAAVRARLAACAQVVGPIQSTYRWQGAVDTAQEFAVVFKTQADRGPELIAFLRQRHSYETPEILATPVVDGDPAYLDWIAAETRASE
jgi:periplasmic divalent cation tolerance protein